MIESRLITDGRNKYPADSCRSTDVALFNEARKLTDVLIDAVHSMVRDPFGDKPRTGGELSQPSFFVEVGPGFIVTGGLHQPSCRHCRQSPVGSAEGRKERP